MGRRRGRIVALSAAVALVMTACGDGEDDADGAEPTGAPTATATMPAETATDRPEPTTEPETTTEPAVETYEVQQGDTLSEIAQRLGTTVDAIVEANGIDDPSRIFPGDELVIPPGD
jgi:LysM repeat protein